jgi:hypothetical protein
MERYAARNQYEVIPLASFADLPRRANGCGVGRAKNRYRQLAATFVPTHDSQVAGAPARWAGASARLRIVSLGVRDSGPLGYGLRRRNA